MLSRLLNNRKAVWYTMAALIVAAAVLGAGLMITAKQDSKEVSAQSSVDTLGVKAMDIEPTKKHAEKLFGCKVEDINDTAAVVELFEVMNLEDVTGEYTVEIAENDGVQVLSLTVKIPVQQADKEVFDENMEKCAQQMLALIPQVGKVQWTYSVYSTESKEEQDVVSVDVKGGTASLGKSPEHFGKSADKVLKLLEVQAGK